MLSAIPVRFTNHDPSNLGAQLFLGQSLFRQQKFAEAVVPFEKARELEAGGKKLTSDQHRILLDQSRRLSCKRRRSVVQGRFGEKKRRRVAAPVSYVQLHACLHAQPVAVLGMTGVARRWQTFLGQVELAGR